MSDKEKKIKDQSRSKKQGFISKNNTTGKRSGVFHKPIDEPIPTLEKAITERIISGENNSFMILGRDRPGHLGSGFGARGATQAGRIDLIAGLASSFKNPDGSYGPPNEDTLYNPNFALDGARVYISQKADIDRYMGIADTKKQSKPGASAIGLKADAVRIHARNDIKIVTGKSRFELSDKDGERTSSGGLNQNVGTISLIAGNYTGAEEKGILDFFNPKKLFSQEKPHLQPIPKGDNLVECLEDIFEFLGELVALVRSNAINIGTINTSMGAHFHMAGPVPTTPSPVSAAATAIVAPLNISDMAAVGPLPVKLITLRETHLNKFVGGNYINSKHVFTT